MGTNCSGAFKYDWLEAKDEWKDELINRAAVCCSRGAARWRLKGQQVSGTHSSVCVCVCFIIPSAPPLRQKTVRLLEHIWIPMDGVADVDGPVTLRYVKPCDG